MIYLRLTILLLFIAARAVAQQIEIAVQKGHSADITFVTFNATGTLLATSGKDNLLKLWHVPTGKEMASFTNAYSRTVRSLAFSPQDDYLYVLYDDQVVHTWNIATSTIQSTSPPAERIPFRDQKNYRSADSLYHVFVKDFYLRKENRKTGDNVYSKVPLDISNNFSAVAVSEKYNRAFSASEDGKIYVYDYEKGKNQAMLQEHYSSTNSICLSPDESLLASASTDRSIIIWDVQSLLMVKRLFGRSFRYEALAFDPTGTILAVGDELGNGKIIDLKSSRISVSSYRWHSQKVSAVEFSPTDKKLFTAGFDNRIQVFDYEKEAVVERETYRRYISFSDFMIRAFNGYREPYAWVNTLSISPGNKYIAAGGGWRESVARVQSQPIWLKNLPENSVKKFNTHVGNVNSIVFMTDMSFLAAAGNKFYEWYIDPVKSDLFFREHKTEGDIQSVKVLTTDTIIVHKETEIEIYSLKQSRSLQRFSADKAVTSVGVHPGKEKRIAYTVDTDLYIRDLRTDAAPVVIKRAHTDRITAIAFSPTRPLLATCGWDATVKLWNSHTGELIATIISMGKEDHMIISPEGYYFGTRNSLKGIGYKYGKQFISPEQFDLRFNRPDIVLARLGFVPEQVVRAYNRAYQKRLQKMNFTEQMLSEEVHLPQIAITSQKLPLHTTQTEIDFQVKASDAKYDLDRINVFVNNIPVYGLQGINVRGESKRDHTVPVHLQLSPGKNKVQVSCLNEKGVESLLETFEIECQQKARKPDLYLAVISVSTYRNSAMNLKYAAKDGRDLINTFSRKSDYYNKVYVDSLLNKNATRQQILDLKKKLSQADVDDQVIVFVSGHGLLDDKLDFYFATHDVDFGNPADRGIKYDDLENLLDGIPCRRKLLLLDACHSGEVDKTTLRASVDQTAELAKNQKGTIKTYSYPVETVEEHFQVGIKTSFELMQELFANVSKGSGAVVIAAAAGNSYALESDEWRNGVFTYAILSGLKNSSADMNRNGHITVTELKDFASREVQRLTKGEQKPTSRRDNLEFDFKVW